MDSAMEKLVLDARVSLRRVRVPRCGACRGVFATRAALRAHAHAEHGARNIPSKNPYICSVCGKQFHGKLKFSLHMKCHAGHEDNRCNICSASFRQISHLRIHIRSKHEKYKRICDICSCAFKHRAELLKHACKNRRDVCRKTFRRKTEPSSHVKVQRALYSCNDCQMEFDNMTELNIHKIIHTTNQRDACQTKLSPASQPHKNQLKPNKNSISEYEMNVKNESNVHKIEKTLRQRDLCQKILTPKSHPHKNQLKPKKNDIAKYEMDVKNESNVHKIENTSRKPDLCQKKLTPKSHPHKKLLKPKKHDISEHDMNVQKMVHTSDQSNVCQKKLTPNPHTHEDRLNSMDNNIAENGIHVINKQSIKSADVLHGYNSQETDDASGKVAHICEHCGKIFKSKLCFDYHVNKHLGINPFTCELCGKVFPSPTSLSIHHRAHKDDRITYSCDMCPKTFKQLSQLRNHKETHVTHHPFQCDVCKISFQFKCNLVRHSVVHNRIRPFKCELCPKSFSFKGNLARHMREKHLNMLPFACKICSKSFSSNSLLNRHKLSLCKRKVFSASQLKNPKKGKTSFAINGDSQLEKINGTGKRKKNSNFKSTMNPDDSISADFYHQNFVPKILEDRNAKRQCADKEVLYSEKQNIYDSEASSEQDNMSEESQPVGDTDTPDQYGIQQRKKAAYVSDTGPYGDCSNFPEEDSYSTTDHIRWVDGGLLLYMTEDMDETRFACIGLHPSRENSVLEHEYTGVL